MTSSQCKPTGIPQTLNHYWLRLWSPQTDSSQAQGWSFVYAEDGSSLLGEYPMEPNPASPPTLGAQHTGLHTATSLLPNPGRANSLTSQGVRTALCLGTAPQ